MAKDVLEMKYNQESAVQYRWNQLNKLMETENLDVVVIYGKGIITQYGYLYYFGGYYPVLRPGFIIYKKNEDPIAFFNTQADCYLAKQTGFIKDTRYLGTGDVIHSEENLYRHLATLINSYQPQQIGIVGLETMMTKNQSSYFKENIQANIRDITKNIESIKAYKSEDEKDGIKKSYALALESFNEFKRAIRPGRTCAEIAAEVDRIARSKGAIDTLIFIEEGPYFLRKPTNNKISENSLITAYVELIDENGYWVEKAGLFRLGEISAEAKQLADSCINALHEIRQTLKPGIPINTVSKIIHEHTAELNVKMGIWHGHGIGVDHDLPILTDGDTNLFEKGMVISVHPNFANHTEKIGVSLADVFIITSDGAESLSNGEYDIIQL